jgi:hypothetical protein
MHRDESIYSNLYKFDPDRYIPKEQGGKESRSLFEILAGETVILNRSILPIHQSYCWYWTCDGYVLASIWLGTRFQLLEPRFCPHRTLTGQSGPLGNLSNSFQNGRR